MDSKTVSKEAILQGMDYLKGQFTAKMDEQTQEIDATYTSLKTKGYLTSGNIDTIVVGIKGKINDLKEEFEAVSEEIRKYLGETESIIKSTEKQTESLLNEIK